MNELDPEKRQQMRDDVYAKMDAGAREKNRLDRQALVAISEAPDGVFSSVERTVLATGGSDELLEEYQEVEHRIRRSIGEPIMYRYADDRLRIGVITGEMVGTLKRGEYKGSLVVPLGETLTWGDRDGEFKSADGFWHEDVRILNLIDFTLISVDNATGLPVDPTNPIRCRTDRYCDTEGLLIGYEEIFRWPELPEHAHKLATFIKEVQPDGLVSVGEGASEV